MKKKLIFIIIFQLIIHLIWQYLNVILKENQGFKIFILLLLGSILSIFIVRYLMYEKNILKHFFILWVILFFSFEINGLISYSLNLNPKYFDTPLFIGVLLRSTIILFYLIFLLGLLEILRSIKKFSNGSRN